MSFFFIVMSVFLVLGFISNRNTSSGVRCSRIGNILPFKDRITPVSRVPAKKNESSFGNRSVPSNA